MAPPDRYQVDAMLHIIDHFSWSYIAAVYSKGNYGEGAVEHLKLAAVRHSVCIGSTFAMSPALSSRRALRENIDSKLAQTGVRVVVLFTDQVRTTLSSVCAHFGGKTLIFYHGGLLQHCLMLTNPPFNPPFNRKNFQLSQDVLNLI